MHTLATAILEHKTAQGVHHDWLVEDASLPWPQAPESRLWTARVVPPPWNWAAIGRFEMVVIPPHRRIYLDYQGPVTGDRGRVLRLARGQVQPMLWSAGRLRWRVRIDGFEGIIDARLLGADRWLANAFGERGEAARPQ